MAGTSMLAVRTLQLHMLGELHEAEETSIGENQNPSIPNTTGDREPEYEQFVHSTDDVEVSVSDSEMTDDQLCVHSW